MEVRFHPEAEVEIARLPEGERNAIRNAALKLRAEGPRLGFPHSSAVVGSKHLRELRPKAGRSRWRALYRRVGDHMFVVAIAPEAGSDPRGFRRALRRAGDRLGEDTGG